MTGFTGFLQADGYSGFQAMYHPARNKPGPIIEIACWAHCRRKVFDVWEQTKSPDAKEALDRIAAIYVIEDKARFAPAAERVEHRKQTAPLLAAFFTWAEATVVKLSAKSALAEAFRYILKRREALTRFVTDGRLEVDNNIAENAMRKIATPGSLCTSFSSIWKHWKLIRGGDVTRAPFTPSRLHHGWRVQVGGADLERRTANDLLGGKDSSLDQLADPVAGDAASLGRLAQGQPGAVLLGGLVGVNVADTADRANPMGGPGLALTSRQTHSVERGGDILVGPVARHLAHHRQGIVGGAAAVFTRARLTQAQFGMPPALPMNNQNNLLCRLVDVDDDLVDKGAHQLLAATHGDVGVLPRGLEILGDGVQVRHRRRRSAGLRRVKTRLAGADAA
jgi:hypothetical protein